MKSDNMKNQMDMFCFLKVIKKWSMLYTQTPYTNKRNAYKKHIKNAWCYYARTDIKIKI